jgi:hypothetical protein
VAIRAELGRDGAVGGSPTDWASVGAQARIEAARGGQPHGPPIGRQPSRSSRHPAEEDAPSPCNVMAMVEAMQRRVVDALLGTASRLADIAPRR